MLIALLIGLGIPGIVFGLYLYGRIVYGEQWYLAFGENSAWGEDDPLAQEINDRRIIRLHLNDRPRDKTDV